MLTIAMPPPAYPASTPPSKPVQPRIEVWEKTVYFYRSG